MPSAKADPAAAGDADAAVVAVAANRARARRLSRTMPSLKTPWRPTSTSRVRPTKKVRANLNRVRKAGRLAKASVTARDAVDAAAGAVAAEIGSAMARHRSDHAARTGASHSCNTRSMSWTERHFM